MERDYYFSQDRHPEEVVSEQSPEGEQPCEAVGEQARQREPCGESEMGKLGV